MELPDAVAARVSSEVAALSGKCRAIASAEGVGDSRIAPPGALVYEAAITPRAEHAQSTGYTQQTIDVQLAVVIVVSGRLGRGAAAQTIAGIKDDVIDALFGWTPSGARDYAPLTLGTGVIDEDAATKTLQWRQHFGTYYVLSVNR